jgi:anti-sigma B factor antagonist
LLNAKFAWKLNLLNEVKMIFKEKKHDIVILKVTGNLDSSNLAEAGQVFHETKSRKSSKIIIDMGGLQYINSMGIDKLITFYQDVTEYGGRVILTSLQPVVKEIFQITKMDLVTEIYPDKESAFNELARK